MVVKLNPSALRESHWYEYVVRFVFGGLITAATGVIAKKFGPAVGGLFLAFPAIFPATTTLIAKHQREKKEQKGLNGAQRARSAAALDAAGAAMGSLGLLLFAVLVWAFLPNHRASLVLAASTAAWLLASIAIWVLRRKC